MGDVADSMAEQDMIEETTNAAREKYFSLQGLINAHVAKLGEQKKEYKSWRCSSLGSCPRKHFYARLGIEPTSPPDERTQRVFEVGNIFHEWIQSLVMDTTISQPDDAIVEQELYDQELDLGGRYDMRIKTRGKDILFDIKTQHSRAFWWMLQKAKGYTKKDGTKIPPTPISEQKKEHRQQLGGYMLMLKRMGAPVDEGRMLYVSKDDLCMEEITFHLTPELEKSVLDELAMLNKHWAEKTLPPCTCAEMYDGKGIQYCNFQTEGRNACCDESLYKQFLKEETNA